MGYSYPVSVRGRVAGSLHLGGFLAKEGTPLLFDIESNGTVEEFACMCEGAFTKVVSRARSGEAFTAEKLTYRNEEETPDKEKLDFLRRLAEHLGKRVEANLDSQERSRS